MQELLGVLDTLKINNTIWIQLGCFIVSYLALSKLVFKPYFAAYEKRKASTVGGEELAAQASEETAELTSRYEAKAKKMNAEFKKIYNEKRTEAVKEYETIVNEARVNAQQAQDEMSQQIANQVKAAKEEVSKEVSSVSLAVASKLVGKEISQ